MSYLTTGWAWLLDSGVFRSRYGVAAGYPSNARVIGS